MADLFVDVNTDSAVKLTSSEIRSFDDFLNIKAKAKELLPQINWVFTHRKTEYLAQILNLRQHSSIQIRRKIAQGIGFLAQKEHLEDLQKWQLSESDRQTWLLLESTIDKIQRKQSGSGLENNVKILTITEGLNLVKRLLGEQEYILEGEISEVRTIKQMYSFAVKDKQDSRLDCWAYAGIIIRSGFPLNEGLMVRITGKFKLSSRNSRVYFDVTKIQLSGEGELLRNLKLLEEKLRLEGLFDESRKRPIPVLPKNILLLASNISAALTDFIKVLSQRRGGVQIYHLPIKTQGVGAEAEVLENLELVNTLTEKYSIDTVVLTRGGGSQDDLIVFNSEKVVRALHGINRPTIVAIGHERDTTLAELAADLRASTPSQAAELVSISSVQILEQLESLNLFFKGYLHSRTAEYQAATNNLLKYIADNLQKRIQTQRLNAEQISNTFTSYIGKTKLETEKLWQSSFMDVKMSLNRSLFALEKLKAPESFVLKNIYEQKEQTTKNFDFISHSIHQEFRIIRSQFELVSSQILLQDPKNILSKGYTIIRQNQEIVEKAADLLDNKAITIEFVDGIVQK